ncbi:MAG: hypothetical protein JW827_08745 [Spirochaetes bacterium]|nr:hypothetical protein [Spirochaetota bacterium]
MKKIFLLFLAILCMNAILRADPVNLTSSQSFLTYITFNYNYTWDIYEIETKISRLQDIVKVKSLSFGLAGGITLYIHPPDNGFGYFPVDNLIGIFGAYMAYREKYPWHITFFPVLHESAHLVDGYERGDINLDTRRISHESVGFEINYFLPDLVLSGGFFYYFHTSFRDLTFRTHVGEDLFFNLFSLKSLLSSDIALFSENKVHTAFNLAWGFKFDTIEIFLYYENQKGLGQDFQVTHKRLGLKFLF